MAGENAGQESGKTIEYSEAEVKALERGWKPKEQWEGPDHEWVPAHTFNRFGELMDRVSHQSKEIKDLNKTLMDFKEHNRQIEKKALERAKRELLAEKAAAMADSDFDRVVEIEENVKETDRKIAEADTPVAKGKDPFAEYFDTEWIGKNDWYNSNDVMAGAADRIGDKYVEKNPTCTPEQIFNHVTKEIKKAFPSYFENPNRDEPPAVGSGASGTGKKGRSARLNLTPEEEKMGTRFVERGLYESLEDYAAALSK